MVTSDQDIEAQARLAGYFLIDDVEAGFLYHLVLVPSYGHAFPSENDGTPLPFDPILLQRFGSYKALGTRAFHHGHRYRDMIQVPGQVKPRRGGI